jgi:hypothetical protein
MPRRSLSGLASNAGVLVWGNVPIQPLSSRCATSPGPQTACQERALAVVPLRAAVLEDFTLDRCLPSDNSRRPSVREGDRESPFRRENFYVPKHPPIPCIASPHQTFDRANSYCDRNIRMPLMESLRCLIAPSFWEFFSISPHGLNLSFPSYLNQKYRTVGGCGKGLRLVFES